VVTSPIPVAIPVTIIQNSPLSGTDRINVLYGSSPFGNIPVTVQPLTMADSDAILRVNNGVGFNQGDLIIISQPATATVCSILQLSQPAQATGVANVTGTGTSWELPHAPLGTNIFPTGGYALGARVLNLGQLVDRSYYVENNMLRMDERNLVNATLTRSYDLIPGVIGLHARYGRDTSIPPDGVLDVFDNDTNALITAGVSGDNTLVAVQISLIVRSGNWEKTEVSPAAIAYWPNGPTVALSADERHYRYRVFQTIVPLKNMIWNN
jgi:type IV pilus assembly protein PilW